MELTPWFGADSSTVPLKPSMVTIRVNAQDRRRVADLVLRTGKIETVADDNSFQAARRMAGEAKALLQEIEAAKRSAKQSFAAIIHAIDEMVADVGGPVVQEHRRILDLLNSYVAAIEAQAAAAERQRLEAERLEREDRERQMREAKTQADRERLELEAEMAREIELFGPKPPKPPALVPGGRVDHVVKFELVDAIKLISAGWSKLLRFELDIRACQDEVRAQTSRHPDVEPVIPGVKITREVSVSVKASARIK